MRVFVVASAIVSFFSVTTGSQALADANQSRPYYFGGSCTSRGQWTAEALQSAERIRQIALTLRDEPNCKLLQTRILSVIDRLQAQVTPESSLSGAMTSAAYAEQAQAALAPDLKTKDPSVVAAALQATIQGAASQASANAVTGVDPATAPLLARVPPPPVPRSGELARKGLSAYNELIDAMPGVQECVSSSQTMAQMFGLSLAMLGSLGSAGPGAVGSDLAKAISKTTNYFREQKFASVLRELNMSEFRTSLQCLIEMSSETFCSIQDNYELFKEGMDALETRRLAEASGAAPSYGLISDSPFNGYMILTQHVPNVTGWLQKIQIGVDPSIPTDATFQKSIINEVAEFNKSVKDLKAILSQAKANINKFSDNAAKVQEARNAGIQLAVAILNSGGDHGSSEASLAKNFFTLRVPRTMIPFYLVGVNELPRGVISALSVQDDVWVNWYRGVAIGNTEQASPPTVMNDYNLMMQMLEVNLDRLIETARRSAEEYYNEWFIVDKKKLVIDSMTSTGFSVRESLVQINNYLSLLSAKIEKSEPAVTPTATLLMIKDTQDRITHVLQSYEGLQEFRGDVSSSGPWSNERSQEIDRAFVSVVNTVFSEFMVMLARSGFIAGRLATLVEKDFEITLKQKIDLSAYQQEIIFASGAEALSRILGTYGGNPAAAEQDLRQASVVSLQSMQALELLTRDHFIAQIALMKLMAENKRPDGMTLNWDSFKRLMRSGSGSISTPIDWIWNYLKYGERYNWRGPLSTQRGYFDTENGDAKAVVGQMCIQALAFSDYPLFDRLCKGMTLVSPFEKYAAQAQIAAATPETLRSISVSYDQARTQCTDYKTGKTIACVRPRAWYDKEMPGPKADYQALFQRNRICAYREFNRKNLVYFLTRGLNLDASKSTK